MGVTIACDGCGKVLEAGMLHDRDTLLAGIAVRGLSRGGAVAEGPEGEILVACCEDCRHTVTLQFGRGRPALYVSSAGTFPDEPSKPM
jgi:ribosomal protein S27E